MCVCVKGSEIQLTANGNLMVMTDELHKELESVCV